MIAPDDDRCAHLARRHQLVEAQAHPVALAMAEPADAGGQALEGHPVRGQADPAGQRLVVGELGEDGLVGGADVGRVAGQRRPPERPLACAEQRPDVGGQEPGVGEGPLEAAELRLAPQAVAVVEDLDAPVGEGDHRRAVPGHRGPGPGGVVVGVAPAQLLGLGQRQAGGDVAERVVGGRLVGDDVGGHVQLDQAGQHLGRVAQQPDRQRVPLVPGGLGPGQRVVEVVGGHVEVAGLQTAPDPVGVDLDHDRHAAVHRHRQRLGAPHTPQPGRDRDRAGQAPAEAAFGDDGEAFVGALQDALGADVDPRPRGHLAVHGQPQRLEAPELLPGRPVGHEVGIGDQHPRRPLVRAEHRHRLARLHEQRLVVLEPAQAGDDGVERRPAARRPPRPPVDDQVLGALGHLGVEVVHQHPQRGLLGPALAAALGAAGRPDRARPFRQRRPPPVRPPAPPSRPAPARPPRPARGPAAGRAPAGRPRRRAGRRARPPCRPPG